MTYNRVNWKNNPPSNATPISAENLNIMDKGIEQAHEEFIKLSTEITDLKAQGITTVLESYVKEESESVIDRVIEAQGSRTFTFAAITDLHYGSGSYTDGIKHACQAMKYIDSRIKLDAVAILGDHTDGFTVSDYENGIEDTKAINNLLTSLRFAPNLRQQGNHDFLAVHSPITHRTIQAYSDDVTWGNKIAGYYYRDFNDYKLRVISLNTAECGNGNIQVSTEQYNWFIESLDLTAKENASEWQILILSHHPLDWYSDSGYSFAYILDAYQNGTSWSSDTLSCDYTNKNVATMIGNIHGHIHNLLVDYLYLGNANNTTEQTSVLRIATPEATPGYGNHYDGVWKQDTRYAKTQNTAKDTSFVIYCINLDAHTINAICYGAGYDRVIGYGGNANDSTTQYTNLISTSIDTDGNIYNEVGYMTGYRLNSSGNVVEEATSVLTGYIPYNKGQIIRISGYTTADKPEGYLQALNANFEQIDLIQVQQQTYNANTGFYYNKHPNKEGIYIAMIDVPNAGLSAFNTENVAYIRISMYSYDLETLVCTLDEEITGDVSEVTNLIPLSIDSDGTLYNGGQGWKADTRLNSSGAEASYEGVECTGFIPAKLGDIIYLKNIMLSPLSTATYANQQYLATYDSNKNLLTSNLLAYFNNYADSECIEVDDNINIIKIDTGAEGIPWANDTDMAYFRISAEEITSESIITVNEEIV